MKSSKRPTPFTLNLPPNDRFVIAFSGGIDSLALISFMSEEERNRSAAVYVDHSIRKREELDEEIKDILSLLSGASKENIRLIKDMIKLILPNMGK